MMSHSSLELETRIEQAIQSRDFELVRRRLLPELLKKKGKDDEVRLLASDFYRRIGDLSGAVRVIHSESELSRSGGKTDRIAQRMQIRLARLLNLLGASAYALRIVERVPSQLRKSIGTEIGGILLSNYRHAEALPFYEEVHSLSDTELDYSARLRLISYADCCAGLKRWEEASEATARVLRLSQEPLLLGIAHQAQGAYDVLAGKLGSARQHLEESSRYFKPEDQTQDRGFLEKWIGALLVLQGEPQSARKHLERSWELVFRPGFKPEAWLEVLYWIGRCEREEGSAEPEAWARLLAYPSLGSRFADQITAEMSADREWIFSAKAVLAKPAARHVQQHPLGIGLPERLLGLLSIAGRGGVPQYRLYEALWPEELFAFESHQKRLEQVVGRLRREGAAIDWKDHHLSATRARGASVAWSLKPKLAGHDFLENREEFTRNDVEAHYRVSRRSAATICANWVKEGVVHAIGAGPGRKYILADPAQRLTTPTRLMPKR